MSELLQRSVGPQVHIAITFPLTLDPVLVDPNQLELALMNFAVNARDAMPNGGRLAISAEKHAVGPGHATGLREGLFVELSIADNGHGMNEETRLRATEPFFTTKGVGKGTGLGLSMVHGLAEQSGGRLIVHSHEGEGTRMAIWLPVASAAGHMQGEPAQEPSIAPAPIVEISPLRIMAVDDDNLVLTTMSAQLEDLGHRVTAVSSAEQALQMLEQGGRFDLLITDHSMPGMTGSQLAEMLRENLPEMPVVVATGYAEIANDGRQDIPRLHKPFTQEALAVAIVNAVETARNRVNSRASG
jgi:CheY-like chemotaxis protein